MFDAETAESFNPTGRCPFYQVREDVALAVREKQRRDDAEIVALVNRGTPTVPVTTGGSGGMNATFLAAEAQ